MRIATDVGDLCIWLSSAAIVIWIIQYTVLAQWYRNVIGITLVGFALVTLAIYIPSLIALADPADMAGFAATTWYRWLAICIVTASAAFIITRIAAWERIRRRREQEPVLPAHMAARIAELEAENAHLQDLLAHYTESRPPPRQDIA